MIAKGNTHDNGARLARYMTTGKEGELAELWELHGFALRDITDAFRSVHVAASKGQCRQPFFHVQVRNPEDETLTRSQWKMAIEKIEGMLGLGDQPRAIAVHTDREKREAPSAYSGAPHRRIRHSGGYSCRLIAISRLACGEAILSH